MADLRTVASTRRVGTSAAGNPTYDVVFTDGTSLRTAPDTSLAYGVTNSEYADAPHEVVVDGRGRLIDLKAVA